VLYGNENIRGEERKEEERKKRKKEELIKLLLAGDGDMYLLQSQLLRRIRQGITTAQVYKASLGNISRSCLKKKKNCF
jgi:hypothetical protein